MTPFTLCAAPLSTGPADEVTLERPCEALEVASEAVSLDFVAALEATCAASDVVEACRRVLFRAMKRGCRSISRDTGMDMTK